MEGVLEQNRPDHIGEDENGHIEYAMRYWLLLWMLDESYDLLYLK